MTTCLVENDSFYGWKLLLSKLELRWLLHLKKSFQSSIWRWMKLMPSKLVLSQVKRVSPQATMLQPWKWLQQIQRTMVCFGFIFEPFLNAVFCVFGSAKNTMLLSDSWLAIAKDSFPCCFAHESHLINRKSMSNQCKWAGCSSGLWRGQPSIESTSF